MKTQRKFFLEYTGQNENENENTTYQNVWNAAKVVLRGKLQCIVLHPYIENEERFQIDNLNCYFKQEKEQNKPEVRRPKKLLRYRDTERFNIEKTEKDIQCKF